MWYLRAVALPHFKRHKLRTVLSMVGIACGVAAIVASSATTTSAFGSFRKLLQFTAGDAEFHVVNGRVGVPEAVVEKLLEIDGVAYAAPLVDGFVQLADDSSQSIAVLGIDVLGDGPWRAQIPRAAVQIPDEIRFITNTDSVIVSASYSAANNRPIGSVISVTSPTGARELIVRGIVDDVPLVRLLGPAVVMDLLAAQELLGRGSKVDRIDIGLSRGATAATVVRIRATVMGFGRVADRASFGKRADDLLFSMRVVLSLASAMALVVGFFLILHTMAVSLAQRRREMILLEGIGITPLTLYASFLAEAAVLGAIASATGWILGLVLSYFSLAIFGELTSAWIELPAPEFRAPVGDALFAVGVGIAVTVLATLAVLAPEWLRATRPSEHALQGRQRQLSLLPIVVGLSGLVIAIVLIRIGFHPSEYGAVVRYALGLNGLILFSFGLLGVLPAVGIGRLSTWIGRRSHNVALMIAGSHMRAAPSASAAVVVAIVLGFAWTLADAALVGSLKQTWLSWMDEYYHSDLIVTGEGAIVDLLTSPTFPGEVSELIASRPDVDAVQGLRLVEAELAGRPIVLEAIDDGGRGLPVLDRDWTRVAAAFRSGDGVLLSDNLARLARVETGHSISIPTPGGERRFEVLGRFADLHGGDLGSIAVSRSVYTNVWGDTGLNRLFVWGSDGVDAETLRAAIQLEIGQRYGVRALTFEEGRAAINQLIDSAFASTYALVLVAAAVSFVGVVNFLLAAALDRRALLRTLYAVGLTPGQLAWAFVLEGTLIGIVGVAVGMIAGAAVSWVIITDSIPIVVGWLFDYRFPTAAAVLLSMVTILLAAVASLVPSWAATRDERLTRETPL